LDLRPSSAAGALALTLAIRNDNSKKRGALAGGPALAGRAVRAERVPAGEPVRLRAARGVEQLDRVRIGRVAGIITDAPADQPTVRQLRDDGVTVVEA